MSTFTFVLVNLLRNKVRTVLTSLSVVVALFLFCSLQGVLDTLKDAIKVGSETRLVTRNNISLVFPLPLSYFERLKAVPDVDAVTYSNWFGAQWPADKRLFFAQFAVDAPTYFPMYSSDVDISNYDASVPQGSVPAGVDPKLSAFMADQQGCVVGDKLMTKMKWKIGQQITLAGTIYPGEWPFTIRAVYHPKKAAFNGETVLFHWKYLQQRGNMSQVGTYTLHLKNPDHASQVTRTVDAMFENSGAATRTETERAFQAGFISMYGNIPFMVSFIGFAIAFAILLVAANTMMMAVRERTNEYAVLKTLGFLDGDVFAMVVWEGALITVGGGLLGAVGAKYLLDSVRFDLGGVFPPIRVHWNTVGMGVALALVVGAVSGLLPAWQASRLKIVDALRRVN